MSNSCKSLVDERKKSNLNFYINIYTPDKNQGSYPKNVIYIENIMKIN